jgi:hypothetical protein
MVLALEARRRGSPGVIVVRPAAGPRKTLAAPRDAGHRSPRIKVHYPNSATAVAATIGGKVLVTGRRLMQFEVTATKAGKAKVTVAVTECGKTTTQEYALEIE